MTAYVLIFAMGMGLGGAIVLTAITLVMASNGMLDEPDETGEA